MKKIRAIAGGWWNYLFGGGDAKERARREITCYRCPYEKACVCTKCGCFIPAKAAWKEETCPEDRW